MANRNQLISTSDTEDKTYMALSKNKIKYINSLSSKKCRDKEGLFTAEGTKLVLDLMSRFKAQTVVATKEWLEVHNPDAEERIAVDSADEIKKISRLSTPAPVFVTFRRSADKIDAKEILMEKQLVLALDTVQDPGNLGTIIRIADWFGIKHVICSQNTADVYNPKVIQSTMGALARVNVHYTDLQDILPVFTSYGWPVYGTFLDGENIHKANLSTFGIIVMGNEGNGISGDTERLVSHKLLIPSYPPDAATVESLNVAAATAVTCAEFRRRQAVTQL